MAELINTTYNVNLRQFLELAPHIMRQKYGLLIRGKHGIGKSQVIYQLAREVPKYLGLDIEEMPVIDKRLSQCADAGDIVGIPSIMDEKTTLNPMTWFHMACTQPCILLFDELDRAQIDVKQAIFEVGDSRKIDGRQLHKDTIVVACVNGGPDESQYQVKTFDPAELDRWAVMEFQPTVKEWLSWAKNNVQPVVYDFIKQNDKFLEPEKNKPLEANQVYPSRRSWKRFSDCIPGEWIEKKNPLLLKMAYSFVGFEAASSFNSFVQNWQNAVDIQAIINKGDFGFIKELSEPKLAEVCAKISDLQETKAKLKPKQIKNIANFTMALPLEIGWNFWNEWSATTHDDNFIAMVKIPEFSAWQRKCNNVND